MVVTRVIQKTLQKMIQKQLGNELVDIRDIAKSTKEDVVRL